MSIFRKNLKKFSLYICERNPSVEPEKICEEYKIDLNTYYRWKSLFGSLTEHEAQTFINEMNQESQDEQFKSKGTPP